LFAFDSREALFGDELSDYTRIKKMLDTFDPFLQFWDTADKWKKWSKSWLADGFNTLDAEQVEKDVMNSYKTMFKMGKAFQLRNLGKCADNCGKIRDEVEVRNPFDPPTTMCDTLSTPLQRCATPFRPPYKDVQVANRTNTESGGR
jgi:dynein heavy chain